MRMHALIIVCNHLSERIHVQEDVRGRLDKCMQRL